MSESIDTLRHSWEALGRYDPMWAILSDPAKRGNLWEPEKFYGTGVLDVGDTMAMLKSLDLSPARSRMLDFGCGLGRLTEAFAAHFDHCDGVDISGPMIDGARRHWRSSGRVSYLVAMGDAVPFPDETFDFVYSRIVLQHIPVSIQRALVTDFVRVLKPRGRAMFQTPSRCLTEPGSQWASPIDTPDGTVTIDMNAFPIADVLSTIAATKARLLLVKRDYTSGPKFESFTYLVSK